MSRTSLALLAVVALAVGLAIALLTGGEDDTPKATTSPGASTSPLPAPPKPAPPAKTTAVPTTPDKPRKLPKNARPYDPDADRTRKPVVAGPGKAPKKLPATKNGKPVLGAAKFKPVNPDTVSKAVGYPIVWLGAEFQGARAVIPPGDLDDITRKAKGKAKDNTDRTYRIEYVTDGPRPKTIAVISGLPGQAPTVPGPDGKVEIDTPRGGTAVSTPVGTAFVIKDTSAAKHPDVLSVSASKGGKPLLLAITGGKGVDLRQIAAALKRAQ